MTIEPKWRERLGKAGVVVLIADALAYIGKCLIWGRFYDSRYLVLVYLSEAGIILSIAAFVLAVIGMRRAWRVSSAIFSVAIGYLWFCDLTWFVMVK
jgi:hypothetical protein